MPDIRDAAPIRRGGPLLIIVTLLVALFMSRSIASYVIEYQWWKEVGQFNTWLSQLSYGLLPVLATAALLFIIFWLAYHFAWKRARSAYQDFVIPRRLVAVLLLLLSLAIAGAVIDTWTVVRYFGSLRLPSSTATEYTDPIFSLPLKFYFFNLPFYRVLLRVILAATIGSLLIFWITTQLADIRRSSFRFNPETGFEFQGFSFREFSSISFLRIGLALLLIALAVKFFLDRYNFLFENHGIYLVGADYVTERIALPLQWLLILAALAAAGLILAHRAKFALLLLLVLPIRYLLPPLVTSFYVRPNELTLEKPYIDHHIKATRSAYGLTKRTKETQLAAQPEIQLNYAKHKPLLDNVRLWDWQAFHDTISQIQYLRPYTFVDSDIDRYMIDGSLRQTLISPREIDIRQLGDARSRWINPHFVYTHGYGLVMAEANRITHDGLPVPLIGNAPPEIRTKSLKFDRPQIYFGEVMHEPIFVNTQQQEFDYPSGAENVHTRYQGRGGFPISSFFLRLAAALKYGDINILLTSNLSGNSRMMIQRQVSDRLSHLAGFLQWDSDPYLVLTKDGHAVWILDGYMTSSSHPYSKGLSLEAAGSFNYIRNSVKATVDAYDGTTNLYVFDESDPLIQAYWKLFPDLFQPVSAMPADLREHARYPESMFSAQAEIYRTYHMRDPEAFYNRADLWDIAQYSNKQGEAAQRLNPTYVVAALPGEEKPEFLLLVPFTPANRSNLIGLMLARCDGEHLGELIFQQVSKQEIILGPTQIGALINQDQTIAKDLALWNQQGSQVIKGQMLVLPIENSFLYVSTIYIQAAESKMPQLKKVALVMGNRLAYADTYEQALSQLMGSEVPTQERTTPAAPTAEGQKITLQPAPVPQDAKTIQAIRDHFQRYRSFSSQGKWAEAGKELETIDKLLSEQQK